MRFILIWNDEHDSERNVRRIADGLDDAVLSAQALLENALVYDEEKASEEFYEDALMPAMQAFLDEVASDDLATFLTNMRTGETRDLKCEGGTFEITRDR